MHLEGLHFSILLRLKCKLYLALCHSMITVASAQAHCGEKIVTRSNSGFEMRISYFQGAMYI